MLYEIKYRITGATLFSLECGSLKLCVEAAVKARADLAGANLDGKLKPATAEESIANLDKVREIILDSAERLDMDHWHGADGWQERTCAEEAVCGTTHCLAGWLQVCATEPEVKKLEAHIAGYICAPVAAKMFYRNNDETLSWLRARKYEAEVKAAGESHV